MLGLVFTVIGCFADPQRALCRTKPWCDGVPDCYRLYAWSSSLCLLSFSTHWGQAAPLLWLTFWSSTRRKIMWFWLDQLLTKYLCGTLWWLILTPVDKKGHILWIFHLYVKNMIHCLNYAFESFNSSCPCMHTSF